MKITRKGLEKKLDQLVKEIVFIRDKHCVSCPIWKELKEGFKGSNIMQPGHLFKRGSKNIRWDLRNVYQQCKTCNYLHNYHDHVLTSYALGVLGEEGYNELIKDRHNVRPIKKFHLEIIREQLEAILEVRKRY